MSGTRRSGRCRFFVCLGVFVIMVLFVAIFHSTQLQLDDSRESRLRCEQQQQGLNEQLQSIVEHKHNLEKVLNNERNEQMETRRNLEQKLKDAGDLLGKEQMQSRTRYDKLQQTLKLLQGKEAECVTSKKQLLEDNNACERKHQSLRSELQVEKKKKDSEINVWEEKYNSVLREKQRLELLLSADSSHNRILSLESAITEYQKHCNYKPQQQQINKPLNAPDTTRNSSPQPPHNVKPINDKSFAEQKVVSPGLYYIGVKFNTNQTLGVPNATTTNKQNITVLPNVNNNNSVVGASGNSAIATAEKNNNIQHLLPFSARNNRSLILNSVENFQIVPKPMKKLSEETETQLKQQVEDTGAAPMAAALVSNKVVPPLSAPRKSISSASSSTKSNVNALEENAQLRLALNATSSSRSTSSSSTSLPPLALPPNQRKLPENVAPIPENFDQLIQPNGEHKIDLIAAIGNKLDQADIDAAVEDLQKNENDDANNNRYANVVNEMEAKVLKVAAAKANEDSGAHEIKDHDFVNDQNFNLPADADNQFFDGLGAPGGIGDKHQSAAVDNNDDDDLMGGIGDAAAGDMAVKQQNHLLDTDNLNNEIAGDQGKEFPDGLRLDDGNEEDEDEDDYSNMAARKQGAQAIRN